MQRIPCRLAYPSMLQLLESKRPIRKTAGSSPRVSVYDVLGAVTGYTPNNCVNLWQRLSHQFPAATNLSSRFKFPGRGQHDTPVADTRNMAFFIAMLPGRAAAAFRKELLEITPDADELLDAEAILRERGCSQEQIGRLAGELGKDIWLIANSEGRTITTADKQFGVETRAVKQYHRGADAKLIDDVLESFRQRPLWQKVMANDPTTLQRQQLLAEHGRGRKKQRIA
jgi:hypothetical protein